MSKFDLGIPEETETKSISFKREDLLDELSKQVDYSPIFIGIVGENGTGKTGCVLDCRTEEEKERGMKVIVFDLDTSAGPLKTSYFGNDENIVIINPFVYIDNVINYTLTHEKIIAYLNLIHDEFDQKKIKLIAIDSADALLEISLRSMREDLELDPKDKVEYSQWDIRNIKYWAVIRNLMRFPCAKAIVTHYKKKSIYDKGAEKDTLSVPRWLEGTADKLFQRIEMERVESKDTDKGVTIVDFIAYVKKAKGNLKLEGKRYNVGRTVQFQSGGQQAQWKGLFSQLEKDMNEN